MPSLNTGIQRFKINITIHFSHFKVDISITLRIRKHKNKVHSIIHSGPYQMPDKMV